MSITLSDFLLICLAGGLGSMLRASLTSLMTRASHPAGAIFVINSAGSLLIGLGFGIAASMVPDLEYGVLPKPFVLFGMGFLGGFTTVSTFALQVHELWLAGRARAALIAAGGSMLLCPLMAAFGLFLALGGL